MSLTDQARELLSKFEVLKDLESTVREMMATHERKRVLWMPSDLLGLAEGDCSETHLRNLRARAAGIPDAVRAALAVNTLTEEGLPHFHRLLAVYLDDDSYWRLWNNLWTAEEDRHGQVLHDYTRDTQLFDQRKFEEMQFEYIRAGFHPVVGSRSLSRLRLHHGAGARDAALPRRDRPRGRASTSRASRPSSPRWRRTRRGISCSTGRSSRKS